MTNLRRAWRYLLGEPFTWIFYAFFQTHHFDDDVAPQYQGFWQRFICMLRLIIPMFLIIFPFALVVRAILLLFHLESTDGMSMIVNSLIGSIIGILVGMVSGVISDISDGMVFGLAGGIAFAIAFSMVGRFTLGMIIGATLSATLICVLVWYAVDRDTPVEKMKSGIIDGIALCIPGAIFTFGIAPGIMGSIAFAVIVGILTYSSDDSLSLSIFGSLVLVGIPVVLVAGFTLGFVFGIIDGIVIGVSGGLCASIAYVIGYFRLPLYLVSGLSLYKAYYNSRKKPQQVFDYLRHSSLHWDERVYLPLPFLKETLLIAYNESHKQSLEEIDFIVAKRPQQLRAAQAATIEITILDLKTREKLDQIAGAADRIAELLSPETKMADPHWTSPISRLSDASRDAMRAITPIGLQGRRRALDDMQANLVKVHPDKAFRDPHLNAQLVQVVESWRAVALLELEQLSKAAQDVGNLDNPYKPGQFLSLEDSLFVGRRNLAQELEGALSMSSRRPTFLLNGERRMGKTSALQQLPYLLGSGYVSVFYNLQQPGLYASSTVFLSSLAEGISREMNVRAIPVEKMDYGSLQQYLPLGLVRQSDTKSDANVYRNFERWLAEIEDLLEQEQRTLLLAFDEFEMLEEAELSKYMDVRSLLNWMRSVIQFHPRIVLLFSGVKTFDEMGRQAEIDWTSYFINVQILRVSFLKSEEARHLIIKPTSDYPGESIFPPDVVEMIITETGCHPFLLQAVCSGLITLLNVDKREQAEPGDVDQAVERVLEDWESHFANLWKRSDDNQRACLEALLVELHADMQWLVQHTGLDERTIRHTLQKLVRRDLVLRSQSETYCHAVPMFRRWLEHNA